MVQQTNPTCRDRGCLWLSMLSRNRRPSPRSSNDCIQIEGLNDESKRQTMMMIIHWTKNRNGMRLKWDNARHCNGSSFCCTMHPHHFGFWLRTRTCHPLALSFLVAFEPKLVCWFCCGLAINVIQNSSNPMWFSSCEFLKSPTAPPHKVATFKHFLPCGHGALPLRGEEVGAHGFHVLAVRRKQTKTKLWCHIIV